MTTTLWTKDPAPDHHTKHRLHFTNVCVCVCKRERARMPPPAPNRPDPSKIHECPLHLIHRLTCSLGAIYRCVGGARQSHHHHYNTELKQQQSSMASPSPAAAAAAAALVVKEIWIYPLKSGRGLSLPSATVGPTGFAFDRQWMLVNSASGR